MGASAERIAKGKCLATIDEEGEDLSSDDDVNGLNVNLSFGDSGGSGGRRQEDVRAKKGGTWVGHGGKVGGTWGGTRVEKRAGHMGRHGGNMRRHSGTW